MERYLQEIQACGCICYAIIDGVPDVIEDPYGAASTAILLHEDSDSTYITLDLETTAASLQALLPTSNWEAYLAIQTDLIRSLRHAAYTALDDATNWRESLAEAGNFGTWLTSTQAEIAAIEAQYPFPGEY